MSDGQPKIIASANQFDFSAAKDELREILQLLRPALSAS
jgi:hypothetical protein